MKNICVIYYYDSNKNSYKEEYESAYLAAYLKDFGFVKLHMRTQDFSDIAKDMYNYIFIKLYNHNCISLFLNDLDKLLSPDTRVFLYGQYAQDNFQDLLNEITFIDGIIMEDLESTCNEILHNNDIENTKGIVYKTDEDIIRTKKPLMVNIDDLPMADRRISVLLNQNFVEVMFSKGCMYNCSYCSLGNTKKLQFKSKEKIIEELEFISKILGIKKITFKDLSFEDRNIHSKNNELREIAQFIIDRTINIDYSVHFRSNSFSENDLPTLLLLRTSGLTSCLVGIESFLEKDLLIYNKGISVENNINFIKLLRKAHIDPSCSFIFINPWSTIDDLIKNIDISHSLLLLAFLPPALNVLRVEKRTPIYLELLKSNMLLENGSKIITKYEDQSIEIVATVFNEQYSNKVFWKTYYCIKKLQLLKNELAFKYDNRTFLDPYLSEEINTVLKEVNDINRRDLLDVVNFASKSNLEYARKTILQNYYSFANKYKDKIISLNTKLYKEIEVNRLYEDRKE